MRAEVIIIGGGPAGMAAALFVKRAGASVLLLEHNEKLGSVYHGKGRCNVTNDCEQEEFLRHVLRNPGCMRAQPPVPSGLIDLLHSLSCQTVTGAATVSSRQARKRPMSQSLRSQLAANEIRLHAQVVDIVTEGHTVTGVRLADGAIIPAKAVILATGGLSYPITGSTGIGHELAKRLGHTILPCSPSLTGFNTQDAWPKKLQGLTLKNVKLSATWPRKGKFTEQGELLFTHFGVSGPLVLSLSGFLAGSDPTAALVTLDLKPALSPAMLEERLLGDIKTNSRRTLHSLLREYLPASMAAVFPDILGLDGSITLNQFTQKDRTLIEGFKPAPAPAHSPPLQGSRGYKRRMDVREVNPSTMASKLVGGLYFAGERMWTR